MRFGGILPPDAPDPQEENRARVRALPFPVLGLVRQDTIEDTGMVGMTITREGAAPTHQTVAMSYTLWRNPDDRDDPVNLAVLDAQTQASLDVDPPWPRPAWLVEQAQRLRYPVLWEAVRTSWHRDPGSHTSLAAQLVAHVNHVLMNRFREELGIPSGPLRGERAWRATEAAVDPNAVLEIDGRLAAAAEVDTDPFVYGIGAQLTPRLVVTTVIARDDLPFVRLALATRGNG